MNAPVRIAFAMFAMLACTAPRAEQRALVLVARSDSPVVTLDSIELRKLYLGIPVWRNGRPLQPLLNRTSVRAEQVFLQTIVAMSAANYEHRVLQMAVKFGRPVPRSFRDLSQLQQALDADAYCLTYMWSDEAPADYRRLRVIWRQ